jgi:pleiotropic regulator 1
MATSALPSLEPLLKTSAKRTRDVFASCADEGLRDDEKRLEDS